MCLEFLIRHLMPYFTTNTLKVYNGMDVVRSIEKVGTNSGKTKKKVVIVDCGQIWSEKVKTIFLYLPQCYFLRLMSDTMISSRLWYTVSKTLRDYERRVIAERNINTFKNLSERLLRSKFQRQGFLVVYSNYYEASMASSALFFRTSQLKIRVMLTSDVTIWSRTKAKSSLTILNSFWADARFCDKKSIASV